MAYLDRAIVLGDHESEVRIIIEPGYMDDRDRDCLRLLLEVKGARGEMRLPLPEAKELAALIVSQVVGYPVRLTHRRDRG